MLWITCGTLYFCRNNLGVALPGIQKELGFDKAQLGNVLMALKLAYGAGQFINGQLAERVAPRKLLALGMVLSAGLNVALGFGAARLTSRPESSSPARCTCGSRSRKRLRHRCGP